MGSEIADTMVSSRRIRSSGETDRSTRNSILSQGDLLNESVAVLDPAELLAMVAGESDKDEDEDEERDIVTDLDGQFAAGISDEKELNFEPKRKRKSEGSNTAADGTAVSDPAPAPAPAPTRLIKTIARIRKVGPEAGALSLTLDNGSSTRVTTTNPKPSRWPRESFEFDIVLDSSVGQAELFRQVEPAVSGVFEGANGIILAYGATGSGKTHTMGCSGGFAGGVGAESDAENCGGIVQDGDGIVPRSLERMYEQAGRLGGGSGSGGGSGPAKVISIRAIEIYNNKPYDLLREGFRKGRELKINEGGDGEDVIVGLSAEFPPDLTAALDCVKRARGRAQINRTSLNDRSSRGHAIFVLGVHEGACKTAEDIPPSDRALYVADLAGPERHNRAAQGEGARGDGSSDSRRTEAAHINLDTTALFRAWKQVRGGATVSYRGRSITRVLKSLFITRRRSPRVNCVMVVCLNPAASEFNETIKVLKNSKISSNVLAAIQVGPPVHKRRKVSRRDGGGGGRPPSASGTGYGRPAAAAAVDAAQASGPWGGPGLVAELRQEIERLQAERATMIDEYEEQLYETEKCAREEAQEGMEELEKEITLLQDKVRLLNERLQAKSPIGAGARMIAAQSAMKRRIRQAESARKLDRETTREADDEATRQSQERARAEKALTAALAEKARAESEMSRAVAAEAAAEAAADRLRRERSEERFTRRELAREIEQLRAAAAEEAGRREDLQGQLCAAKEEITRLRAEKKGAPPAASPAAAAPSGEGRSSRSSSACYSPSDRTAEGDGGGGVTCEDGARNEEDKEDEEEHEEADGEEEERQGGSTAGMVGALGSGSGSTRCSAIGVNQENCEEDDEGGQERDQDERQEAEEDEEEEEEFDDGSVTAADDVIPAMEAGSAAKERHHSPVTVMKTRSRRRLGQVEAATRAAPSVGPRQEEGVSLRRVLGNLQNGATPARSKVGKNKKKGGGGDENRGAPAPAGGGGAAVDDDEEGHEEEGVKPSRARGARGKRSRADWEKAAAAVTAKQRKETKRCREMRKNARLSKPSPEAVVMTDAQAKMVDNVHKIIRDRRRRGMRRR